MNTIIGTIQAGLIGNNHIPKPRFILEVPGFRIHDVENEPDVAQELDKVGFGIISYTWGRFQDKTTYEDSPNAPKFDLLNVPGPKQIWWYIPKLQPNHFTIGEVRGIVEKLNMKYVWWDWACIPQSWDSNNTPDPQRHSRIIGYLPEAHKKIADQEVEKQFYIYTLAKKGVIWLRDIEWLSALNPHSSVIQKTLEKGQRFAIAPDLATAIKDVKTAVEIFQHMKVEDNWLSSMWTFQEGVLLNTDDVIDPRDNRLLATRSLSQFARLVDKNGKAFEAETCFRNEATLLDITGRATLLACDIAALVIQAIQAGHEQATSELQEWLGRLYETGLVGVAADSPLDILEAAKARGITTTDEVDYCVNAVLGALRVVLPPNTPSGRANPSDLDDRRRALLSALVDRHGWKMLLLSKPTRGAWDPNFPDDITSGAGDWVSILGRAWQFTSLGVFITSLVGHDRGPTTIPPTSTTATYPSAPAIETISLTSPVPYTDNVLLLGAARVHSHLALPRLRHARALGLAETDALVVGPEENPLVSGSPAYGAFWYGVAGVGQSGSGGSGGGGKRGAAVTVAQGPAWTACRFYASEADAAAPANNGGIFPVKTAQCSVRGVEFGGAFREDAFGAGVVLLPIEDVSVFRGTVKTGMERVVVLRCVVLTGFKTGTQRGSGVAAVGIGGGIFLGIGDFTFQGSPAAVTVQSVLGDGWMIYMY